MRCEVFVLRGPLDCIRVVVRHAVLVGVQAQEVGLGALPAPAVRTHGVVAVILEPADRIHEILVHDVEADVVAGADPRREVHPAFGLERDHASRRPRPTVALDHQYVKRSALTITCDSTAPRQENAQLLTVKPSFSDKIVLNAGSTTVKPGTVTKAAEDDSDISLAILFDIASCDPNTASADQRVEFSKMSQEDCQTNLYSNLAQVC
jgi:hypothetical protein